MDAEQDAHFQLMKRLLVIIPLSTRGCVSAASAVRVEKKSKAAQKRGQDERHYESIDRCVLPSEAPDREGESFCRSR